MKEKQYGTVNDLVAMLENCYTDDTYYTIFSIVTDEDWTALEAEVERLEAVRGATHSYVVDYDLEPTTNEYLETINVDS